MNQNPKERKTQTVHSDVYKGSAYRQSQNMEMKGDMVGQEADLDQS